MKGLYNKYHITKADGTDCDPDAEYFVLRLDSKCKDKKHLEASLKAIAAYATDIEYSNPDLHKDITKKYINKTTEI